MYDLEIQRVADEIKTRGARRVLLQLPDGLRPVAISIAEALRKLTNAEVILNGDSCYGACDLALSQAEIIEADLIVHYAHSKLLQSTPIPVIYIEAFMDFDLDVLIDKAIPHMKDWKNIGITGTIQHIHKLEDIAETLKGVGYNPIIPEGIEKIPYPGQVLGCDYTTAASISEQVDGYLFIGAGRFHPIGLTMTTGKPVVMANPYKMESETLPDSTIMQVAKKRMAAITAAKQASLYGIVVTMKPGQYRLTQAHDLQEKLVEQGKRGYIIFLNDAGSIQLGNFTEPEAFIITACPRLAIDGISNINRPLITVREALIMLEELRWEDVWGKNYLLYQSEGL